MRRTIGVALLAATGLCCPIAAFAAPEEIQVYDDTMDAPGEVGLDIHLNSVGSGDSTAADYPGAEDSLHRVRITPEFSYGITPNLEAGLYLPLATIDRTGRLDIGGIKGRLKYIVHPNHDPNVWLGANFELGRVKHRLDINPWNAEFKLIGGVRAGRWMFGANANFDFVVSGPIPSPASLEVTEKLGYAVTKRVMLGVESYNGVGDLKALGHFGTSEQTFLVAADISFGAWNVNLGIGRGFGSNPDRCIAKLIVGVPLDKLFHRRDLGQGER